MLTASTVQAATASEATGRAYQADKPGFEDPAKTTPSKAKPRPADATKNAAVPALDPAHWPTAGTASADLTAGKTATIRPGGLPVTLTTPVVPKNNKAGRAQAASTTPPGAPAAKKVRVEIVDQSRAHAVGASTLLKVTHEGTAATAKTRIGLNYTSFAEGHGGDYGARLALFQLPACALTATPGSKTCPQAPVPLRTVNDAEKKTLAADIPVGTGRSAPLLAVAATASSSQGSYDATPLAPSATWNVSPSSGGFSWSYPMEAVPTPGGFQPDIGLSYSSQSADGKTAITNNQGSWIGESFGYEAGYIERQYKACSDDGHKTSGELCWAHDNATVMLNGESGQLILDDKTGEWRMVNDLGWKFEKLTGAVNGDDDGEHWKVTADGTEYFFGLNRRTGWTSGKPETNSTWTVPVAGDDSGEPCHKAAFADAWCQQAWRWNLDYAKDRNGNTISYFYEKELNAYARGGKTDVNGTAYTRGGHLERIEYGQRQDELFTAAAPARVLFTTAERCEKTADFDCAPTKWTTANAARWPDTPLDRYCAVNTKCTFSQATPSFFTRKKLTGVTTQLRTGATAYGDVDAWHLKHLFTDNGDGSKTLWLSEIQHEGRAGGGSIKLPSVQLIGRKLDNRVDVVGNNLSPIMRFRLHTVLSESGAQLDVTYKPADCTVASLPAPGASVKRCYPVVWAPPGYLDPITDWFHKYVVASVQHSDRTGKSDPMVTEYDYLDDAGWRKTKPDGITDPKFLTWGQWQGYGNVRVTTGNGQQQTSRIEHTYLKGLNGDEKADGSARTSSVTDSDGTLHTDREEFTGFELEKAAYQGGKIASKTITTPWYHSTGTQTRTWDGKKVVIDAGVTAAEETRGFTALPGDDKWRKSMSKTKLDTAEGVVGRVKEVNDLGDLLNTTDDTCTRTDYADNPSLNIRSLPSRVETVSVACTVTPQRATQVISDDLTLYDGKKHGEAPTRGLVTQSERLIAHDGTTPKYQITNTTTYDSDGRPVSQTDDRIAAADGKKATTSFTYTENHGLVSTGTAKNAVGHTVTTEYAPAWGHPSARTDTNGRRVDYEYDALGRLTGVWQPDRPKAGNPPDIRHSYLIRQDKASAIKTEKASSSGYNPPEYQLFDSLLRPRQHQTEGPNGTRMMADVWYDGHGRIAKTNATYNALGTPSDELVTTPDGEVGAQTRNVYDGMGRPTAVISAIAGHEQWRTTTSYDSTAAGDRIHSDPPPGSIPTTSLVNEAGQVTQIRRFEGASPVVSGPLGAHTSTSYTYRPAGQLATVTDDDNNIWSYAYDQLGRKTKTTDPDAGITEVTYDAADRPTTVTDPRGKSVTTAYDVLSRPLTTHDGPATTSPRLTETKYDRAGAHGYPYASHRYVSADKYFAATVVRFDSLYRPIQQAIQIPDTEGALKGTYLYTTTYNPDGTVKSTGLPAMGGLPQETLVTTYDDLQRPTTLTSASNNYVTNTAWTPTSQLSTLTLNTGGKQSEQHFFYEKGTDRVERQLVTVEGMARAAKDVHTSYDLSGNVLSVADTADTSTPSALDVQCYAYDGQRRLTEIWTPQATAATAAGSGTVGMATPEYAGSTPTACTSAEPGNNPLGGPAPYWTSYSFDKIGNRSKEIRHDVGRVASKDIVRTYTYSDANQNGTTKETGDGGPHAVTKVTEKSVTGPQDSFFSYDASGNTVQRKIGGDTQTLRWNSEGKVDEITEPDDETTPDKDESKTTTFLYDSGGNRLKRTDPSGTTLYLPGATELHLPAGTGTTTQGTRYYSHAGETVAVRTAGKVSFIAADRHGTGDLAIDATTGAVTQRRTDPYGNPRSGGTQSSAWPGQKGFVGGTIDAATSLTNIGARQYDADLGKFISVDPIIDVNDPQQMNGYSYANDNPTTYADPTGLVLGCGGPYEDCPSKPGAPKKKKPSKGGGSGSGPGKEVNKAQKDVDNAQQSHNNAKQKMQKAADALGKELLDQLGVTAAMDCISTGNLSDCGETLLNVASYLVGAKAVQIAAGGVDIRRPWEAPGRIKRNVGLLGDLVFGLKETYDTSKKLDRAKDKLAAAKAKETKRREKEKCHSFLPGTLVLLADGSTKAIEDVEPGDEITTTNPQTGKEVVRKVVGTIVTEDDKNFVDLTITTDGVESSLISTTTHPFWVEAEREWIRAGKLKPGMHLTTPSGSTALVEGTRYFEKRQRTHDLTIGDLHAYYVLTGVTPLLVHNCDGGFKNPVSPGEITELNRQFGGMVAERGSPGNALLNASRYDSFWEKSAVIIRDIAGAHMFDNGNKRTAHATVSLLMERNGITSGPNSDDLWSVISRVATPRRSGHSMDVGKIASMLRGY
ncbi:polymorphic toxin-type HINT domain-containing protein [Streptomyces sp. CAU 1734]|uniref:polymorphic toxin-type HINT domain-containing protein n=1 Tax=Streptomyces sp. CAU 1734 TaxID=3140360 RepID=UPI0032603492